MLMVFWEWREFMNQWLQLQPDIRDPKTSAFNADKIFPWVSEYKQNPAFEPTQQDNVNNALLAFMTAAPGFSMERIKNVG